MMTSRFKTLRHGLAGSAALTLMLATVPAWSQEWALYPAFDDSFSANFPGDPTIRETKYTSEFGVTLPARVYSAKDEFGVYSLTAVDWRPAKEQHVAIYKKCMAETGSDLKGGENPGVCTDRTSYEIGGATLHAAAQFLKRDGQLQYFARNPADNVDGIGIELLNADKSQTFGEFLFHKDHLYILEATAPEGAPVPSSFTISIQFLDEEGRRIRYEGPYSPLHPVPKRSR
jgi:hypothetical protein